MARFSHSLFAGALLMMGACSGGDARVTAQDRDGDGLTNAEEASLGSNPDAADTDRDGWDDGDELDQNTDPLNGFDFPYTGGWPIADCRNDIEGSRTNRPGQVAQAFSLMDQHGDPVRLHDFCDRKIVLASAAVWCLPCQEEATFLEAMYQEYADDGLMVITLLGEDIENRTPSLEVLQEWADTFGVTTPILQDTSFSVTASYSDSVQIGLPANHLLGEGAAIQTTGLNEVTEDTIRSLLGLP